MPCFESNALYFIGNFALKQFNFTQSALNNPSQICELNQSIKMAVVIQSESDIHRGLHQGAVDQVRR